MVATGLTGGVDIGMKIGVVGSAAEGEPWDAEAANIRGGIADSQGRAGAGMGCSWMMSSTDVRGEAS